MNITKKNIIIGSIGIVVSVLLTVLTAQYSGEGNITEQPPLELTMRILSLLFICTAAGSLGYILLGAKGFLLLASPIALLVIIQTVLSFTSEVSPQLSMYIICCAGLVLSVWMSYKGYKNNNEQLQPLKPQQEKEEQEFEQLEQEFRESIGYPSKSIIVSTQGMGHFYQIVKCKEGYLFHRTGSFLKGGLKAEMLITDTDNAKYDESVKEDYFIAYKQVEKVTAKISLGADAMSCGTVKLSLDVGKNKRYNLINLMTEEELKQFFGDIEVTNKTKEVFTETKISDGDSQKLAKFNKVLLIRNIVTAVILALLFLTSSGIGHTIITVLSFIVAILPLVMYIAFPKYLSMADISKYQPTMSNGKLNLLSSTFVPVCIIMIRMSLESRNYVSFDFARLAVISAILFVVLLTVMLLTTAEYKKKKSAIFTLVLGLIMLCGSLVYGVDTRFDFQPTQMVQCRVTEHSTHTDNNDNVTYYLHVEFQDKILKIEVSKQTYEQTTDGQHLTIAVQSGALGIEKAIYYDETLDDTKNDRQPPSVIFTVTR